MDKKMKKLSDEVTFKHGAVISNRMVQHKDKWGEADAFPMAVANAVFGQLKSMHLIISLLAIELVQKKLIQITLVILGMRLLS